MGVNRAKVTLININNISCGETLPIASFYPITTCVKLNNFNYRLLYLNRLTHIIKIKFIVRSNRIQSRSHTCTKKILLFFRLARYFIENDKLLINGT